MNPSPDTGAGTPLTDAEALTAIADELVVVAEKHVADPIIVASLRVDAGWLRRIAVARSRPATDPAGLDVERWRLAVKRTVDVTTRERVLPFAEKIAAEYASLSVADGPGPEAEPCPFCAVDRPGAVGAGCMECRGRGTVGPAFRRNRGLPPLARLSVADGPGPEGLREELRPWLEHGAECGYASDTEFDADCYCGLVERLAALSRPLPENREEPSR